ncbi:MAG: T9SS type A sorting domain-containing protein, partial [Bacteroidetes bacterium]|nr:T9SS type A sorting domain-containing protein [Bacteroidota bacterium]
NGNELWRKKYNNPSPNYAEGRDVIEDSATKNILVTGMRFKAFSNGSQISERFVTMFDSLGNIKYDLPNSYMMSNPAIGIIKDINNNYYIFGNKNKNYISGHYTNKAYIVKFKVLENSLQTLFDLDYGKEYVGNHFTGLFLNNQNNLEAIGMLDTNILNNIQANVMIQKYQITKNGNVINKKIYNYYFNENWQFGVNSWGASLTSDGGIIAPYQRLMNNANNYAPVFFVKYDSLGCDTSAFYCATVGIKENTYQTADVSIYPQPANQIVNLSSPLFANKRAQIQISNNLGQLCFKQRLQFNNGNAQLPLVNLPKGIYFLKLIDEDFKTYTQKIIVE